MGGFLVRRKGFNEMKGDLGKIDYERLLEELEPISAELMVS